MNKGFSTIRTRSLSARKLAQQIAEFASDKKAEDITILDMRKVANFCDYFVLCTGNTNRQIRAIVNGIDEGFEKLGIQVQYRQGVSEGHWVVLDLGNVVAHIFDPKTRDFYGLEYLWQQAKKISWS